MKFLIAGLGNIGPEYELTRHNIGFLVLDRFADNEKQSSPPNDLPIKPRSGSKEESSC
jgi:PTH1 family peptidyl-tRNA hydrolase